METNNTILFSEFGPISKEQWVEKVNADLKGADFDKTLVWKNLNNISIQPFYTASSNIKQLAHTGKNSKSLKNYRIIEVDSANNANIKALKAIEEGINGLLFNINKPVSVDTLLSHVDLDDIAVSFILNDTDSKFIKDFFEYVDQNIKSSLNLKGYFDLNLIPDYVSTGTFNTQKLDVLKELITLSEPYPNYKSITISGTHFLDSGANQTQEIAYTLNALIYIVEQCLDRDIHVETFFKHLHIQLAIGSEYFVEIGKFRAFNNLLHEIVKEYNIRDFKHMLTAKTAIWSKSVTDAHTNVLRATTEVMSAILGNVDGVLVDPYDSEFNEASNLSNRVAGNITTILKEESYFGKVANPVDGSYYIEEVSTKIAENALALFKAIQEQGGFYKAFENEVIQQQIAEIRQTKIKLLSQRRLAMVGVNKYPNLMETVPSKILSAKINSNPKLLIPRRASIEIEAIRKATEELVETTSVRPIVELSSFGNLTMRKARAAFSYDFMGVSGFKIWDEKSYDNAKQAAEASAKSESDVVVICSSDPDYDESALTFVETFRVLNKDKVLLLAGNPVAIMDDLTKAGLDGCINLKSDVIQVISSVQQKFKSILA